MGKNKKKQIKSGVRPWYDKERDECCGVGRRHRTGKNKKQIKRKCPKRIILEGFRQNGYQTRIQRNTNTYFNIGFRHRRCWRHHHVHRHGRRSLWSASAAAILF